MVIPDVLIIMMIFLSIVSLVFDHKTTISSHIIGAFLVSMPMLIMAIITKGCFGGGDIKLMFAAGILLGAKNIIMAVCIAIITGGIYCIFLLAVKKMNRNSQFPFGPFLSLGIAMILLFGNKINFL